MIRAIDLFCGAGGSSWGAKNAGIQIAAGFDCCEVAGRAFMRNHPDSWFYHTRLEDINPYTVSADLGRIDLILASPECTNHSPAKGNSRRCEESKATAFQVVRFARAMEPRWVVVENVANMRQWSRYGDWIRALKRCGYQISEQVLNAVDFGVPQSRRRLFVIGDLHAQPRDIKTVLSEQRVAMGIIDMNGKYNYSPLHAPKRAKATLERASRAIAELGKNVPFLLVYYGSDKAGGWQKLNRSLRTITTIDRFALVKPTKKGHVMRMLQIPELKAAMGYPKCFNVNVGTRRDGIRLLGNGVCAPQMRKVLKSLINE